MSRLSRAVGRRDKARHLMMTLESTNEDSKPLSVASDLTRLLRDIPSSKIGDLPHPKTKLSPEWETIAVVARCASLIELWDTPLGDVPSYIPAPGTVHVDTLKGQWKLFKEDTSKEVLEYLQLLAPSALDFNV